MGRAFLLASGVNSNVAGEDVLNVGIESRVPRESETLVFFVVLAMAARAGIGIGISIGIILLCLFIFV